MAIGRIIGDRIAIAADTILVHHGTQMPVQEGTAKLCMLPGGICASFSNSPELAEREFARFVENFPNGADFDGAVSFFEEASQQTGNDFLIGFSRYPRLAKISNGRHVRGVSNTQWIGDQVAYQRFREHEVRLRNNSIDGRAVNAVLFADELQGSPASDLFSIMRHVVADADIERDLI